MLSLFASPEKKTGITPLKHGGLGSIKMEISQGVAHALPDRLLRPETHN